MLRDLHAIEISPVFAVQNLLQNWEEIQEEFSIKIHKTDFIVIIHKFKIIYNCPHIINIFLAPLNDMLINNGPCDDFFKFIIDWRAPIEKRFFLQQRSREHSVHSESCSPFVHVDRKRIRQNSKRMVTRPLSMVVNERAKADHLRGNKIDFICFFIF